MLKDSEMTSDVVIKLWPTQTIPSNSCCYKEILNSQPEPSLFLQGNTKQTTRAIPVVTMEILNSLPGTSMLLLWKYWTALPNKAYMGNLGQQQIAMKITHMKYNLCFAIILIYICFSPLTGLRQSFMLAWCLWAC